MSIHDGQVIPCGCQYVDLQDFEWEYLDPDIYSAKTLALLLANESPYSRREGNVPLSSAQIDGIKRLKDMPKPMSTLEHMRIAASALNDIFFQSLLRSARLRIDWRPMECNSVPASLLQEVDDDDAQPVTGTIIMRGKDAQGHSWGEKDLLGYLVHEMKHLFLQVFAHWSCIKNDNECGFFGHEVAWLSLGLVVDQSFASGMLGSRFKKVRCRREESIAFDCVQLGREVPDQLMLELYGLDYELTLSEYLTYLSTYDSTNMSSGYSLGSPPARSSSTDRRRIRFSK